VWGGRIEGRKREARGSLRSFSQREKVALKPKAEAPDEGSFGKNSRED
jgi:hypothetical protein